MRVGDNHVACFPENLHLVMQGQVGEMNVKGGNDLSHHEPENNDEADADWEGWPFRGLDRINKVIRM
jgi:hypothetical protein